MIVWETTFNDTFFLTLAGIMFGFWGLMLMACLKSRCKEFRFLVFVTLLPQVRSLTLMKIIYP